jgi:hypothetical protein
VSAERNFSFKWGAPNESGNLGPFIAARNRVRLDPTASDTRYFISYSVTKGRATSLADQLLRYYPDELIKAMPEKDIVLFGVSEQIQGEIRPLLLLFETQSAP